MTTLALITGATGGIGSAIAHTLAEQGYTLILHGRSQAKLNKLLQELTGSHHSISADISKPLMCEKLIDDAFKIGTVSLLVNNAGVSHFANFASSDIDEKQTTHIMQINLIAPILLTKAFISRTKPNFQGTIVNVGSALGSIGFPGFSLYCASKFGLKGLSEVLSREYADSHIRVVYFGPRTTNTSINSQQVTDMNKALNNKVDSPEFVASQFMQLLNSNKRRKIVGWPEKLFARINGVLPELVDKAFKQKTQKIKQFANIVTGDKK
jgi:short-subunit dehydrogenase